MNEPLLFMQVSLLAAAALFPW